MTSLPRWMRRLGVCGVVCALVGCEPYQEALPRRDRLNFPIGLAIHPDGRYLYAVNSNFDARYAPELGGTVSVIDTKFLTLNPQSTPYIPSFGGMIRLNEDATRAYVTARKDNVVVAFDISATPGGGPGSALTCPDASGRPSSDPARCVLRRIQDPDDGPLIPEDPFGLDVTRIRRLAADGSAVDTDLVTLSHLSGSQVSALSVPLDSLQGATLANAPVVNGSNAIARRPGTLEMYAAGRNESRVAIFVPYVNGQGEAEAIFTRGEVLLDSVATTATRSADARDLKFSADGRKLYVATRSPDALYVYDLGPSDEVTGRGTDHQLSKVIPLGDQPSSIVVHQDALRGELVLVTCFDSRTIQVVDPNDGVVLDEVRLDADPYDLVVNAGVGRCQAPGQECRGFVSLFSDGSSTTVPCEPATGGCGSIGVIDLDPGSDRYLQVIGKIR